MIKSFNAIQPIDTTELVKKTDYKTKFEEIEKKIPNHDNYVTTNEFNQLTAENFVEKYK